MTNDFLRQFADDVDQGLSGTPKSLSSKYFYDEKGDQLFVKIMNMPEYYLTDCEFEIFSQQTDAIVRAFGMEGRYFELYELGAGDGTKSIELLKGLEGHEFTYKPIDISPFAIEGITERVNRELSWVKVEGEQGEYFQVLNSLKSDHPKVILFMGSNIGNLKDDLANHFLNQLSSNMNAGDKLVMGVDLIKPTTIVLPAYNDAQGYTREFNLNLLDRMNRELGANFDRSKFEHIPEYDETEGWARSFIKSLVKQEVRFEYLNKSFAFEANELIDMEISRKYNSEVLKRITKNSGLVQTASFNDSRNYFSDVLFEKVNAME